VNAGPQIPVQFPEKLGPLFTIPKTFKVMHGGRGGGKSHTVAQFLLLKAMEKRRRILCVREVQKSLAESSMQVLKDYIARLGLSAYFEVLKSEIRCRTTGSAFSFSGLKDHTADSIKSFEGADIVWCEEAHSITAHSWNVLIPTILRTDGAEIWATFNPDQETDYVYDRFVKRKDPNAWVTSINWRDNPWFNDAMNVERMTMKALNDDLYQHIWEGKCRSQAGLLFKRRWFKRYKLGEHPKNLRMYMATDYAGAPDPDEPEREPDWNEFGVGGMDVNGALWSGGLAACVDGAGPTLHAARRVRGKGHDPAHYRRHHRARASAHPPERLPAPDCVCLIQGRPGAWLRGIRQHK